MEFFATCGFGLEHALAIELRTLRTPEVRPLKGGVTFKGELPSAYRALLWSRVASRILLTIERIPAADADELYEGVKAIAWEEHVGPEATIAVDARGLNDNLRDTRFTALKVKDAICDRLRDVRGSRPDVDGRHPDVRVNVSLNRDRAIVSLDLSGGALHHRGYRDGHPLGTPIGENLAAALLIEADWPRRSARGANLIDPCCGGGTIAIEAACMAASVAPGILRSHWGFTGWLQHDEAAWSQLLDEADERAESAADADVCVFAADRDARCIAALRECSRRAGVSSLIDARRGDASDIAPVTADESLLVTALPHAGGEVSLASMPVLLASIAGCARSHEGITNVAVLAADDTVDAPLRMEPTRVEEVRNGADEACLRFYDVNAAEYEALEITVRDRTLQVSDPGAQQFASRLNKMAKQRGKWARKNDVASYRVYDADLPDFNFAIDVYGGAGRDEGQRWIHIAEYAPPKQIDPAKAARRLADALVITPVVFEVDPTCVFVKERRRARGGSQYAGGGGGDAKTPSHTTIENGLLFDIDLGDYLDTGLFLDHRDTRALIRKLAPGRSFLNLFAYTGSATVYAAAGGAPTTTTVDLSNTYLERARLNMKLNGFTGNAHSFERADALRWANDARHSSQRWDLIFVDPPTFSNSAKMGSKAWDVQRDHAELLIDVSRLLNEGGAAVFSCNLRGFEIDRATLANAGVQVVDISDKTIPEDFLRNPNIHRCYLIRRA